MIVSVSKKTSALRRGLVNGSAAVCAWWLKRRRLLWMRLEGLAIGW